MTSGRLRTPLADGASTQARKMRERRVSWSQIERTIGVSADIIRRRLDPEWATFRANRVRTVRAIHRGNAGSSDAPYRIDPAEAARALATIPRDTRSLSSRILGDPLPGRSALDRRSR